MDASKPHYTTKIDWTGNSFLGFTLKWNFEKGYVDISMSGYIDNVLEELQYKQEVYPQYSPHKFAAVKWTSKGGTQYAQQEDEPMFLSTK